MPVVLAPLAAIIIALAALLIIAGNKQLSAWIVNLVPSWHIPGLGNLRDSVRGLVDASVAAIEGTMDAALAPIKSLLSGPATVLGALYDDAYNVAHGLFDVVSHLATVTVPWIISTAAAHALSLVNAARAELGALITAARQFADDLYHTAVAHADAIVSVLKVEVNATLHTLSRALDTLDTVLRALIAASVAAAEHRLTSLIGTVQATLTTAIHAVDTAAKAAIATTVALVEKRFGQAISTAETLAADAQAAAIKAVDIEVPGAIAAVWPDVLGGIDGAIKAGEGAFDDVLGELAKLARSVPADVAAATALAGASSIALTRYLERCGIPNCRNLSQLGRDLQALLGLVDDAAFIGLVTDLALRPVQAAHEVDAVLGPLARDTTDAAAHLVGVR